MPGRIDVGGEVSARDIIIATGSVPFVPPGECGSWKGVQSCESCLLKVDLDALLENLGSHFSSTPRR